VNLLLFSIMTIYGRADVMGSCFKPCSKIPSSIARLRLRMEDDAILRPRLAEMDGRLAASLSLCTALFRRRIVDAAGYFDETLRFGEDTDYLVRLAAADRSIRRSGGRSRICGRSGAPSRLGRCRHP
jgi:GT2 family glycosyltransferase